MNINVRKQLRHVLLALLMLGAISAPARAEDGVASEAQIQALLDNTAPAVDKGQKHASVGSVSTPSVQTSSAKSENDDDIWLLDTLLPLVCLGIVLCAWASLPYMIWVLVKEKRRRFEPIPLPAGSEDAEFDAEKIDDACDELGKFICSLEEREINGEMLPVYTTREQVDKGYELLGKLKTLQNMNPDTIRFINSAGIALNEAQKRHLRGSKVGLVIAVLAFAFWACMFYDSGSYILAQFWAATAAAYYLAMLCPAYKMANPFPRYYTMFKWIVKVLGIGALFTASDMAEGRYATVYKDSGGRLFTLQSDREAGCFISLLLAAFVLAFVQIICLINCVGDFIRNYLGSK